MAVKASPRWLFILSGVGVVVLFVVLARVITRDADHGIVEIPADLPQFVLPERPSGAHVETVVDLVDLLSDAGTTCRDFQEAPAAPSAEAGNCTVTEEGVLPTLTAALLVLENRQALEESLRGMTCTPSGRFEPAAIAGRNWVVLTMQDHADQISGHLAGIGSALRCR